MTLYPYKPRMNEPINNGTTEQPSLPGARKLMFAALILFTTVGLDRIAKIVAQRTLRFSMPMSYLNDFIRFEYAENTGAFLSLGSGLSETARFIIFGVGVGFLLVGMLIYIVRTRSLRLPEVAALSLIAAGGVGNLYDRLTTGYVVDFVSMGFTSVRTGIFNVADVAITSGILLFLWLRVRKPGPENPPSGGTQDSI